LAKRVAVIDIGSNSIRMVVYEKTSRFAFHLLYEAKSKVRISEDAYKNGGSLQEIPMQRAYDALVDFLTIISSLKVRKILCVATSALRDAPNKQDFILRIRDSLKLNIKVIDGIKEAYFGAIACANLLPLQHNALSVDIGGGSTEFALIDSNNVKNTLSIDLGTVRLKELFFDTDSIDEAIKYIDSKLDTFILDINPNTIIGIGGTFRAITNAIIDTSSYPYNKLHAFECDENSFSKFISKVLKADKSELKKLGIKSERFDIIKPGVLIFQRVLIKLNINKLITSGVGVREGVYLADLLRGSKDKFPKNYNTSVRYLLDSHVDDDKFANQINILSKKIFDLSYEYFNIDRKYRYELAISAKLYLAGSNIHFYSKNKHSYYLIQSALEYGFTHSQTLLIATLVRYAKRKLPSDTHVQNYSFLLPDRDTLDYLSYILSLSIALLSHKSRNIDFDLKFDNGVLSVESKSKLYISKEAVKKLSSISGFKIKF